MLDENTSSPRRTSDRPTAAGNYLVRCGRAYQVVSVVDECGTLFAHHANGCRQVDRYSKFCEWEGPYYTEDAMTEAIRCAEGEGASIDEVPDAPPAPTSCHACTGAIEALSSGRGCINWDCPEGLRPIGNGEGSDVA